MPSGNTHYLLEYWPGPGWIASILEFLHVESGVFFRSSLVVLIGILLTVLFSKVLPRWIKLPGRTLSSIIWLAILVYFLNEFENSRPIAIWLDAYLLRPLALLAVIVAISIVVMGWMTRALSAYFEQLESVQASEEIYKARRRARLLMVREAALVFFKGAVFVAAALIFLGSLHINIAGLLAGAGIFGVAIGFATQDLLKDMVAGIYIVIEDQFGVDDLIVTQGEEGWVDGFTLRATRLRNAEGALTTIPNSTIRIVKNLTRSGFLADVRVPVKVESDFQRVLKTMERIASDLAEEWPQRVSGVPRMLGVEEISGDKALLRMLVPTHDATSQPVVRREILLRINPFLQDLSATVK